MNLFETISSQVSFVNLPLFAVSLTALPVPNTPLLLMLHWHGFRKNPPTGQQSRHAPFESVPGSALQLNESWASVSALDEAMLDAAWQLGAWELDRAEKRACATVGAPGEEELACCQAFARHPMMPQDAMLTEAPDLDEMLQLGSRIGYVAWKFRPTQSGIWSDTAVDESLDADGGRKLPCPVSAIAPVGTKVSTTRYRLGRNTRLFLP